MMHDPEFWQTRCSTCDLWLPVTGEQGFFTHVLALHPTTDIARAVANALARASTHRDTSCD